SRRVMARLLDRYQKEILPALGQKLGRKNLLSLPRLQKIVVNMGVGKALQDKNRLEQAADQLAQITGQRPQITKARVAVSGFRLREGNAIGCRVTLRGQRMYEFLDRLISVALPRIRDFRGVNPKSFDGHGNYTMGMTEQAIFPEIDPDKINFTQGMDVTFVTSTNSDDEARELLKLFGMPFREAWDERIDPSMATEPKFVKFTKQMSRFERHMREVKAAADEKREPDKRKLMRPREIIRIRLRCRICGRPRAVYRKFGICRICFRKMASDGLIPGVT